MGKEVVVKKGQSVSNSDKVDFQQDKFHKLIETKGNSIIHEKALQCPCKSHSSSAQSNCNNCGGTGWIFINAVKTKAIMHSANRITEYKDWSQENIGTSSVSMRADEKASFMDRITIVTDCSGNQIISTFNETRILSYSESNTQLFTYLTYICRSVDYIGVFVDTESPLTRLTEQQYEFKKNILIIKDPSIVSLGEDGQLMITIRYNHSPQFHVIDLTREFMLTPVQEGNKRPFVNMPVSFLARRAHYIKDMESYSGNKLIDNSYQEDCQ